MIPVLLSESVGVSVDGGTVLVGILTMLAGLVTIAFSLWIALRIYRGYRRNPDRARLILGSGLVMVVSVTRTLQFILPTAGVSPLITGISANASQLIGLGLILYAIYGRPDQRARRRRYAAACTVLIFASLALLLQAGGLEIDTGIIAIDAISAGVGLVVAIHAFLGYRRHGSRPMLYLALGIALLTTVPFAISHLLNVLTDLADASIILVIFSCELLGLVSIYHSLSWSG